MKSLYSLLLLLFWGTGALYAQTYPPLEMTADVAVVPAGSVVDVSVRAGTNWQNITQYNGTITFDTTIISYVGMVFWGLSNPGGATFTYHGGGVLSYTWTSLITIGPTLSNGDPVFTLRFNGVGAAGTSSPVAFANSPQAQFWGNGFGWSGNNFAASNGRVDLICSQPTAAFSTVDTLYTVNFSNTSSPGITGQLWDFGDGNTSTAANPTHTYASSGQYTVCLVVTDSCGTDSTCQVLNVCSIPATAFSATANELVLSFSDNSTASPTQWFWDFGDGNTSTLQNPTHTYTTPGNYLVCLVSMNGCGTDSSCSTQTVTCAGPNSGWTSSANELTVMFTDTSTNGASNHTWYFGDGTTSNQTNPMHSYALPGTYTVCLVTSNACGTDSACFNQTVTCQGPTSGYTSVSNQLSVTFTDTSINGAANHTWSFGDGNTSTAQNPIHIYSAPGTYTVCLVTSNTCGVDSFCTAVTVTCAPPAAGYTPTVLGRTVSFVDISTNGPTAWTWDFGDGNTSTLQSPSHTYNADGTYLVCLVATSACGADTTCNNVTVMLVGADAPRPQEDFAMQVFPQPAAAGQLIHLQASLPMESVAVYTALGEQVFSTKVGNSPSAMIASDSMPAGIYFVRVRTEKGWHTQRMLIQ